MLGGLVVGLPYGRLRLVTGIVMGPVSVEVQRCDTPPETVADNWEDIVELSCRSDVADVYAAGPSADTPAPDAALLPAGSHWFRVRAHARGRDLEYDLVASAPREEYLLRCWPAAPQGDLDLDGLDGELAHFTHEQIGEGGIFPVRSAVVTSTEARGERPPSHQRHERRRPEAAPIPVGAAEYCPT